MEPRKNILSKMAQGVSNFVSPAVSNIKSKIVKNMMPAVANAATVPAVPPSRISQSSDGYQYLNPSQNKSYSMGDVQQFNDIAPSGVKYSGRVTNSAGNYNNNGYGNISIDSPQDLTFGTSTDGDVLYLNDKAPREYTPEQKQEIYDQVKQKKHLETGREFSPYTKQNKSYKDDPWNFQVYGESSDPTSLSRSQRARIEAGKKYTIKTNSKGDYMYPITAK